MANLQHNNGDGEKSFRRWLKGIPYEVAFWQSYYSNRRRRNDLFRWSLYGKPCRLDNFDIDIYIRNLKTEKPAILDVGCALSYAFGNVINGENHNVTYVDPLAPFYNRILQRHKIDRPAIKFGMIETLSGTFAGNSVDFIHVRNALDHCANPVAGIVECLAVLKPGGILYLNHFRNEALNEAYRGFHQYNITERAGKLIVWNREGETDVTDYLAGIANATTTVADNGRIVAVIEKLHDLPAIFYSSESVARQSTERMMETVLFFHNTSNTANYQAKRFISFCGHNLMRLVPMKFLKQVKKIMRQQK